jgi:outer membrane protein assembly factor BamB
MAAYELVTGQRIWELNLAGISTPAIAGDWIFTLTDDRSCCASPRTPARCAGWRSFSAIRTRRRRKARSSGPARCWRAIAVGGQQPRRAACGERDGRHRQAYTQKAPITLAPVVANGVLYLLDDSGMITALK